MIVKKVPLYHLFATYAYFYIDEKSKHGFLIDPASQADKLLEIIKENDWTIEKILITHGHFDHIGAVEELHQTLGIPYYIYQSGADYLKDVSLNLSTMGEKAISLDGATLLNDGDEVVLEANPQICLKVIHTPGHTTDSATYYDENNKIAFVGDTIFKASVGATHFPGGNMAQLKDSIFNKIFMFPDEAVLYSGHTDETTVGVEKARYKSSFPF